MPKMIDHRLLLGGKFYPGAPSWEVKQARGGCHKEPHCCPDFFLFDLLFIYVSLFVVIWYQNQCSTTKTLYCNNYVCIKKWLDYRLLDSKSEKASSGCFLREREYSSIICPNLKLCLFMEFIFVELLLDGRWIDFLLKCSNGFLRYFVFISPPWIMLYLVVISQAIVANFFTIHTL